MNEWAFRKELYQMLITYKNLIQVFTIRITTKVKLLAVAWLFKNEAVLLFFNYIIQSS